MLGVSQLFFFFSSRRRHTRCSRDWSSDVCSSDLFEDTFRIRYRLDGILFDQEAPPRRLQAAVTSRIKLMAEMNRSEEHTSELQSRLHLVCRLLLEKKKNVGRAMVLSRCRMKNLPLL